jgi:DNA-binding CsgD family transcriptional regulator
LIWQEFTPAEFSGRMVISEKTFFNHRANKLSNAGVRGNVGLVEYAYQYGLIELSSEKTI